MKDPCEASACPDVMKRVCADNFAQITMPLRRRPAILQSTNHSRKSLSILTNRFDRIIFGHGGGCRYLIDSHFVPTRRPVTEPRIWRSSQGFAVR
ncbi:hypothetical protein IE81DRAFT_319288 [Ceraceosorus guamensis]|uniref:Uncharacterized protein n=1 Tax=Ceraceosorus guamensis TaxID=1522189 RepID=A0A316WCP2_9BASI|nr:hypothetical protein IE81DRAFT_319288 [Ceraceosorus guamensis]PWN46381.1 hypothetical protein IE81DRAFT_319288 [Ceraceosorus guamensis]